MYKTLYGLLILVLYFLAVPAILFAAWEDHHPVVISASAEPGSVDVHANSGGRRIVRIGDYAIVICPHGSGERTYRSTDNGETWIEIDQDGAPSGCLITGAGQKVYHFYRSGDHIYMVRFRYDEQPPAPVSIYSGPNVSEGGHGAYNMVNATVDAEGSIYVITHWDDQNSGGGDTLYMIKSTDQGDSWTTAGTAQVIHQGSAEHSWGYANFDVTEDNNLVGVYSEWGSGSIQFAKSTDKGETWSNSAIASGSIYNPAILPVGLHDLYVFAQSSLSVTRGLVFTKSSDEGVTWSAWKSIDNTSLSGYADPSPGLGANGELLVAYRSGARPDLAGVYGGEACRSRFAMSTDGGSTWLFPDNYFYDAEGNSTERTGTRSQVRYQTWYNYGGPLEWIWMQYEDGGTNRPIYYDINMDVVIKENVIGNGIATPKDFSIIH